MELIKDIDIDYQPLGYHKIATMEVDIGTGVVQLTVRSWFSKAAADSGTPPHRVHYMTSIGNSVEIATVLQAALQAGPLADAQLILPETHSE